MTTKALTLLAGTLVLAGCNMAPDYHRPAGAIPQALPSTGVYAAGTAAPSDGPDMTRTGWKDFFLDDRLRQVIALGLEQNRDLRVAAANVLQARAQLTSQRSNLFPTIGATGSGTYTNNLASMTGSTANVGDIEYYQGQLGVSAYELDVFGKVRNENRAAQEQFFASEEARRSTRVSLIAEIANAWLKMASDADQLRLSRKTRDTFKETLDLTRAQFKVGSGSELEVRQAETNYESAVNDIAALETSLAQDQNALDLLVGTTVSDDLLPRTLGTAALVRPDLPVGLSSNVLLSRPDVLQAEHQLIAQNANIGAARAAFFPTISLTGTLGTISTALSGLFKSGTFTYSGAPSVSLPLFDGGARKGNLDYAKASRQAAVATYEKAIQTAFREVSDALAQRGRIDEQVGAQERRTKAAQISAKLADARFRSGVDSFLTSLDSQRTAYAAEQQLVNTRLLADTNLIELYRALGGGAGAPTKGVRQTADVAPGPKPTEAKPTGAPAS